MRENRKIEEREKQRGGRWSEERDRQTDRDRESADGGNCKG